MEEALIEMYLAGVSVRRVEDITEALWERCSRRPDTSGVPSISTPSPESNSKNPYMAKTREVREWLAEITTELDDGTYIEPVKNTVGEWLDTWIGTYAQFLVKPCTLDAYQRICRNYLKPSLGTLRLSALTAPHIQRFYNSLLMEKGLSPKTVRNIHGVLHRALEQAMRLGMLLNNPSELCDFPKTRRKETHPMEQDKIEAFLQAIKGCKYELLYLVTLFTGLRQGEVLGLTWDCVDFNHNTLYINKQRSKNEKSRWRIHAGAYKE